jgi:hypothetical protein
MVLCTAMEKTKKTTDSSLMHGFSESSSSLFSRKLIGILIVVTVLGVLTGFFIARSGNGNATIVGKIVNKTSIQSGKVIGDGDPKVFKDTAEGVLKEGGVAGEGQYHLVRPGGDSQNVYMTSSTVDLSQFLDRKIKVWGQTQSAQQAGWLMDVGKIEVLE